MHTRSRAPTLRLVGACSNESCFNSPWETCISNIDCGLTSELFCTPTTMASPRAIQVRKGQDIHVCGGHASRSQSLQATRHLPRGCHGTVRCHDKAINARVRHSVPCAHVQDSNVLNALLIFTCTFVAFPSCIHTPCPCGSLNWIGPYEHYDFNCDFPFRASIRTNHSNNMRRPACCVPTAVDINLGAPYRPRHTCTLFRSARTSISWPIARAKSFSSAESLERARQRLPSFSSASCCTTRRRQRRFSSARFSSRFHCSRRLVMQVCRGLGLLRFAMQHTAVGHVNRLDYHLFISFNFTHIDNNHAWSACICVHLYRLTTVTQGVHGLLRDSTNGCG